MFAFIKRRRLRKAQRADINRLEPEHAARLCRLLSETADRHTLIALAERGKLSQNPGEASR